MMMMKMMTEMDCQMKVPIWFFSLSNLTVSSFWTDDDDDDDDGIDDDEDDDDDGDGKDDL